MVGSHGLQFHKIDLHTHTPASECYKHKQHSPEDLVGTALEKGMDAIAVTDHNTAVLIDTLKEVAETTEVAGRQLVIFPGVEISAHEGYHLIALFDGLTEGGRSMTLKLSLKDANGYLLVDVEGDWEPVDISNKLELVATAAQERGYTRVLIDARKLSAPKGEFCRFLVGEDTAKLFRGKAKITVVYHQELINKFAENVAVNRGAQILVTPTIDDALNWLGIEPNKAIDGG